MRPLAIAGAGAVTGVGLTAPATCAAIRSAIDNFRETRFVDGGGAWILGSEVPLEEPWRGFAKLVRMASRAIAECLAPAAGTDPSMIPLLLGVAEHERPGRLDGLDDRLLDEVRTTLGSTFHEASSVIAAGRLSGAIAVERARALLDDERVPFCVVAGVDTFLVGPTLAAYEERRRLLTSKNRNGFVPGEGAAAVLLASADRHPQRTLLCVGMGRAEESATLEGDEPLRGDGLMRAIQAALADAGVAIGALDYRITDANGEQYWFKEATLALDRILRGREELFEIWHPADCVGETGAAIGPLALVVAQRAALHGYAFGRGPLCHFSGDGTERRALVLGFGDDAGQGGIHGKGATR